MNGPRRSESEADLHLVHLGGNDHSELFFKVIQISRVDLLQEKEEEE